MGYIRSNRIIKPRGSLVRIKATSMVVLDESAFLLGEVGVTTDSGFSNLRSFVNVSFPNGVWFRTRLSHLEAVTESTDHSDDFTEEDVKVVMKNYFYPPREVEGYEPTYLPPRPGDYVLVGKRKKPLRFNGFVEGRRHASLYASCSYQTSGSSQLFGVFFMSPHAYRKIGE